MNCRDTRARVYPYLDHALDENDRGEVECHLAECNPCRRRFETTRKIDGGIRRSARSIPVPRDLEARVLDRLAAIAGPGSARGAGPESPAARPSVRRLPKSGWPLLAAAGLLAAATLWFLRPILFPEEPGPERIAFAALGDWLVSFHDSMRTGSATALDIRSSEAGSVETFLTGKLKFHCCVPDLTRQGIALEGGSVEDIDCCAGRPGMAYVRYRKEGSTITHIDLRDPGVEFDPSHVFREGERDFYVLERGEACLVAIVIERHICLFVTDGMGTEATTALILAALQ